MKRCSECKRDYFDDTLNFCLEDGAPLLQGVPSELPAAEEPATGVLTSPDRPADEAATRVYDAVTSDDIGNASGSNRAGSRPRTKIITAVVMATLMLAAAGFGLYLYREMSGSRQVQSIAVMPFVNASGNGDIEYLSDGMTETLINSLSQLPKLSVKGRSTVFRYKGKDIDPKQLASELNVQAVLNGRIQQRGDTVSLSLDLIDAESGNQIWGEQYLRKLSDIVTLQNDIARDVSNKLKARLSGTDEQTLAKNNTVNSEAFHLYLQGRFFWNKRTIEGVRKSREFFQKAIDADPTYALAYIGYADSYIVTNDQPRGETNPKMKAKAAALKALELDPSLGEAHAALGNVAVYYEWDWAAAEREFKRAVELSPNYATAHHWHAESLAAFGRFDESFAEYNKAMELDPLSMAISTDLGWAYFLDRQYDRAEEHFKRIIEIDPTYVRTYYYLAAVYDEKQMFLESIATRQKGLIADGKNADEVGSRLKRVENAFLKSGSVGYYQAALQVVLENAKREQEEPDPLELAVLYAGADQPDKAFESLEQALLKRQSGLVFLKVEPGWDKIRSDPRFESLVRRVGLP